MWTFHYWAETYEMDLSTFFPDTLDWSVRRVRVVVLILNLKTHLSKWGTIGSFWSKGVRLIAHRKLPTYATTLFWQHIAIKPIVDQIYRSIHEHLQALTFLCCKSHLQDIDDLQHYYDTWALTCSNFAVQDEPKTCKLCRIIALPPLSILGFWNGKFCCRSFL